MAISGNGETGTVSVPFSYAQAAKGRASTSTGSIAAVSPAGPAKDTPTWTDESSDAQTTVEEQQQANALPDEPATTSRGVEKLLSSVQQHDLANSNSHPSSPQYDSSATTARDDDINSPAKIGLESAWDRKSSAGELLQDAGKNEDPTLDFAKEQEQEQSGSKAMKEAPLPIVNFWQKRAEDAKAKQVVNTAAAPIANVSTPDGKASRPSQGLKPNGEQSSNSALSKAGASNGVSPNVADASTGKNRTSKPGRAHKSESTTQSGAPLPPARDESAWPTPLTAQDEERRKVQEKEGKAEKERPVSIASRPHGKNEWVPVAYTPSVKFNTPLPPTRGRGGRGGGRGGRGGSVSERGSFTTGSHASREESTVVELRGRPENDGRRSSVNVIDDSQTPNTSQINGNEKRMSTATLNKRQSLQEDSTYSTQFRGEQTSQEQPSAVTDKSSDSFGTALAPNEISNASSKAKFSEGQSLDRGKPYAAQGESTSEIASQSRPRRQNTYGNEQRDVTPTDEKGNRPPIASDQPNSFVKPVRSDSRTSANRSFDNQREGWGPLPFREGRIDRGRGRGGRGNHYSLSHHGINQMQNSATLPPIQTNGPYSRSNSTHQSQYFAQNQPADRRPLASGSRSASIPTEFTYGRYTSAFPGNQQQAMFPPYVNAVFDYNAAPMSAMPYTPSMDQGLVMNGVTFQLNYYFSLENLLKDVYLRKHMDSQGFISLNFIANFQRMKDLTTDLELIKHACALSPEFELRQGVDGQVRIRIKNGWDKWVLSMDERDPSAQNEGPPPSEQIKPQAQHGFDVQSATRSAFPEIIDQRLDGSIAPFGITPSFQPIPVTTPLSGARSSQNVANNQSTPVLENNISDSQYGSNETNAIVTGDYGQDDADSFPNSRLQFLTVAVRPYSSSNSRRISRSEASRTFSNGSISMEELKLSDGPQTRSQSQSEESVEEDQLQKVLNSRKLAASPSLSSNEAPQESVELFWFKGQESRQPLPSNSNTELYVQLHAKALEERQHAEPGSCPHDLDVLYQFWSHFLIRNFNTSMYNEFRHLAHEDAAQGLSNVGMQSLLTFYSEALSSQQPIRDRVARHYVSLVKNEDPSKSRPAFEQLKSLWRNGALNMKNRKRISAYVDQELREELDVFDR